MAENRFSAHDYEDVYKSLKLDTRNLGIVMLDTGPLEVTKHVPRGEEDLHFSKKLKFGQGAVAEKGAHMTLLYGLLQPAYRWRDQVDAVLVDWSPPPITISEVGYVPGAVQGEDYSVIVGHISINEVIAIVVLPHLKGSRHPLNDRVERCADLLCPAIRGNAQSQIN